MFSFFPGSLVPDISASSTSVAALSACLDSLEVVPEDDEYDDVVIKVFCFMSFLCFVEHFMLCTLFYDLF